MGGEAYTLYGHRSSIVVKSAVLSNILQRDSNIHYDADDDAFKFTGVFALSGSSASVIAEVRHVLS